MSTLSKATLLVGSFLGSDRGPTFDPNFAPSQSEMFWANVRADLTFYRRSRLLWAFTFLFLALMALFTIPAIFINSNATFFNSLHEIADWLTMLVITLSAGLGLFVISTHLRNRSLKMVFTKPCSPALWLASAMFSAAIACFFLTCVVFAGMSVLSLFWHLPVRTGLLYVSLDTFIAGLGVIAYMVLLGSLMHPAIAVAVVLIFNAEMFYNFDTWTLGTIRGGNHSWFLRMLEHFFHVLYLALPAFYAFGKKTTGVYQHLRVAPGEWKYLAYSLGYSLALAVFCYFVALLSLQRRRHI